MGRITLAKIIFFTLCATAVAAECGGRVHNRGPFDLLYVERDQATCAWPFTTDRIILICYGDGHVGGVAAVTEDDRQFALNGTAKTLLKLPAIDPIWRNDAGNGDARVDLGPWIEAGLELCH